jgi:hypothetical protein
MRAAPFFCGALLLLASGAAAADNISYGVDWAQVATTAPAARGTGASSYGTCMCDLTTTCDANCCCDTDCSTEKDNSFTACDAAQVGYFELVSCMTETPATTVLQTTQERRDEATRGAEAVCVVRSNLPAGMTDRHTLPNAVTAVAALAPGAAAWPAATPPPGAFKVGERLPFFQATDLGTQWVIGMQGDGHLRVPKPAGSDGHCTNDATASFLVDETTTCAVTAPLAASCGTELSVARYINLLLTPPAHALTQPKAVRLTVVYGATGEVLLSMTPAALLSALVGVDTSATTTTPAPGARRLAQTSAPAVGAAIATLLSADGSQCDTAVTGVAWTIEYDPVTGGSDLTTASVVVTVANVTAADALAGIQQDFSLRFVRNGMTDAASVPPRSGHPGYTADTAMLAGHEVTTDAGAKKAIDARVGGFAIPHGVSCADKHFEQVPFGFDVEAAGCGVELTEPELIALCLTADGAHALLAEALTPANFSFMVTRLGTFADSQFNAPNDWVPIDGMPWTPQAPTTYDALRHQCGNLIVGIHWIVGVARSGAYYNPQDIIVAAKAVPIVGAWSFRSGDSAATNAGYSQSAAKKAKMFFQFKVSYQRVDATTGFDQQTVIPPNILPEVDQDVFFPFRSAPARDKDAN